MTPQSYAAERLLHPAATLMNPANYGQAPCVQPPFNSAHLLIQQQQQAPGHEENSYHY
jgi:hypothetical protein